MHMCDELAVLWTVGHLQPRPNGARGPTAVRHACQHKSAVAETIYRRSSVICTASHLGEGCTVVAADLDMLGERRASCGGRLPPVTTPVPVCEIDLDISAPITLRLPGEQVAPNDRTTVPPSARAAKCP